MAEARTDRIELRGGKYLVLSEEGRTLGSFDSEGEAKERLRQIEAAKAAKGDSSVELGVRRYDRGKLRAPRRDDSTGFLHVDASVTRAPAVFPYRTKDGAIRREFRAAESVFSEDNLKRMANAVVTNDHPSTRVTTRNVRKFGVGHADGSIRIEDRHAMTGLIVNDEDTIAEMQVGKRDTSCGYDCDVILKPGVWTDDDGIDHPYDAIQVNHRNNHIAIVAEGRAGSTRVHMDAADAVQMETDMADSKQTEIEIKQDGAADPLDIRAELTALKSRADKLEAERDAAEQARKDAEAKVASQKDLQEKVDARITLLERAHQFITDDDERAKLKPLSDIDVKRACVAKVRPDVELEGKSDEYIAASFDLLQPVKEDHVQRLAEAASTARSKTDRTDLEKRVSDAMVKDDERWKHHVPGGMTADGKTVKDSKRADVA